MATVGPPHASQHANARGIDLADHTPLFSADAVRQRFLNLLLALLNRIQGTKALVLNQAVGMLLSLVTDHKTLRNHAVQRFLDLSRDSVPDVSCRVVCFLLRANDLASLRIATSAIRKVCLARDERATRAPDFHIIFFPRRSPLAQTILDSEGLASLVRVHDLEIDFFPLEDDVLSLELPDGAFRDVVLNADTRVLSAAARALIAFQTVYGVIPRVLGKGSHAVTLAKLMVRLRLETMVQDAILMQNHTSSSLANPSNQQQTTSNASYGSNQPLGANSQERLIDQDGFSEMFDSLIIIDRSVDLLTPLFSQLTYEGLVDEYFNVASGTLTMEVDPNVGSVSTVGKINDLASRTGIRTSATTKQVKRFPLNNSDKIYRQIRNVNFIRVGGILRDHARRLQGNYEERNSATSVSELRRFVGKLGGLQADHQSLQIHTSLSSELNRLVGSKLFAVALEIEQNLIAGEHNSANIAQLTNFLYRVDTDVGRVLSLFCIYSLVAGGIPQKLYNTMRKEIVQSFGHEHVLTLQNLAKCKLLIPVSSSSSTAQEEAATPYATIRKRLRTVVDAIDESHPQDIAYVSSGYSPLSIRLVELASLIENDEMSLTSSLANYTAKSIRTGGAYIGTAAVATLSFAQTGINKISFTSTTSKPQVTKKPETSKSQITDEVENSSLDDLGNLEANFEDLLIAGGGIIGSQGSSLSESVPTWQRKRDVVEVVSGDTFEFNQPNYARLISRGKKQRENHTIEGSSSPDNKPKYEVKRTLVMFLGGCTSTEINALRFLGYKQLKDIQEGKSNTGDSPHVVREFITMTTGILNSSRVINSMTEKINFSDMVDS